MSKRFILPIELAVLAIVLAIVGGVVQNQSAFAVNTVRSQLSAQGIYFQPTAALMADQKQQPCLVANAGKLLSSASQAECFANYQIGLDLPTVDHGKTYYQASLPVRQLEVKMAILGAKDPTSPELPKLEAQYGELEGPASALFQGDSLRGMLLTTYGFAHLGQLGEEAATVLFILAGISLLGAIALAGLKARDKETLELDVLDRQGVAPARTPSLTSAR